MVSQRQRKKSRGNGEGTVYRHPDGKRWVACISIWEGGVRRRRRTTCDSHAQALTALDRLRANAARGVTLQAERLTIGDWMREWIEKESAPSVRPRTLASYRMIVERHLIPTIGHVRLRKLETRQLQDYLALKRRGDAKSKQRPLSARTTQYHLAVLKRALHVAESHGMVDKNVARLVTPPKVQRAEVVPLTPAQSTAFLEAVRGDRLEQLYQVAMATGLRQGELLGLRWEDVDLDAGVLRIRANLQRYDRAYHLDEVKTDKSRRSLAIAQPVVEALRRQRVRQAEDQLRTGPGWKGNAWNLVFTAEDGAPLYGGKVTRRLQAVLKVAGLPKVKFHDLRHGAASFLLAAGVDLKVVQDILGHSTIHTTANVYAHVAPKLRRDAAERIGEVLFSGGAESAAR